MTTRAQQAGGQLNDGHTRGVCSQVPHRLHTAHWTQISPLPGLPGMWVWCLSDKASTAVAPCPSRPWRTSRRASRFQAAPLILYHSYLTFLSSNFYHPNKIRTNLRLLLKNCYHKRKRKIANTLKLFSWNFPGGPAGKTPSSQYRGPGSIPGQGTRFYMPQLSNQDPAQPNK